MDTKDTPGPWTKERLYQALNGRATDAEARLIAAAPELLLASKVLLEALIADLSAATSFKTARDMAAAIAKAEGRA